ncbi:hypothetical protein E4U46_003472 [Claviceps purpurea]|nr:hypothetical protein E4U46_003472 [Claviceps purpurea]
MAVRYDEAASYAQKNGVVEVSPLNAIIKDFVTAVTKVAENWTSNFLDYGRDDPRMTRKEMMRKFRVEMTNKYPNHLQLRSNTKQSPVDTRRFLGLVFEVSTKLVSIRH